MTPEEALDKIITMPGIERDLYYTLAAALLKQIPAKENKNRQRHVCPKCGADYRFHVDYCLNCGQALKDWAEADNDS